MPYEIHSYYYFYYYSHLFIYVGTLYLTSCGYRYDNSEVENVTIIITEPISCLFYACLSFYSGNNISITGLSNSTISTRAGCAAFYFVDAVQFVSIFDLSIIGDGVVYYDQQTSIIDFNRVSFSGYGQLQVGSIVTIQNCNFTLFPIMSVLYSPASVNLFNNNFMGMS